LPGEFVGSKIVPLTRSHIIRARDPPDEVIPCPAFGRLLDSNVCPASYWP
jgi:hypothetical protein